MSEQLNTRETTPKIKTVAAIAAAVALIATGCSKESSHSNDIDDPSTLSSLPVRCMTYSGLLPLIGPGQSSVEFNYTPLPPAGQHGNLLFAQDIAHSDAHETTDTFLLQTQGTQIKNTITLPAQVTGLWIDMGSLPSDDKHAVADIGAALKDTDSKLFSAITSCPPITFG